MSLTSGDPMQQPQVPTGPLPPVAWDPDDHVYTVVAGPPPLSMRLIPGVEVGPFTSSTSFADVPDMVDPSVTGGPKGLAVNLLVMFTMSLFSTASAANQPQLALSLDNAVEVGTMPFSSNLNLIVAVAVIYLFRNVPPGAHRLAGRWRNGSGGGTLMASSNNRQLMVIEFPT